MRSASIRRRTFVALFGGAVSWPLVSDVAQAADKTFRLALVHASHPISGMTETGIAQYRAFLGELRRLGYVEGRNLVVDRWTAEGQAGRYLELARAVVAKRPDVIVAGGQGPVTALKAATQTTPIVGIMSDPVAAGLAFSLAQPGGNLTGVAIDAGEAFHGKRLELLLDMVPSAKRVAYLLSADRSDVGVPVSVLDFAKHRGVALFAVRLEGIVPLPAYERAFAVVAQERAHALFVGTAPVHLTHRAMVVTLANTARLPASYQWRDFVELGGLMSYAPSLADLYRRCAAYVDRILKGDNPAALPILQPEKFELAVNLRTAKSLGLAVPEAILARADEVIE